MTSIFGIGGKYEVWQACLQGSRSDQRNSFRFKLIEKASDKTNTFGCPSLIATTGCSLSLFNVIKKITNILLAVFLTYTNGMVLDRAVLEAS